MTSSLGQTKIDEQKVDLNNAGISMTSPKTFKIRHTFKNVLSMRNYEEKYSEEHRFFGVSWSIHIEKKGAYLSIGVNCEKGLSAQPWMADLDLDAKIYLGDKINRRKGSVTLSSRQAPKGSFFRFIEWDKMSSTFLDFNERLNVEMRVVIKKMMGFERVPLRSFDKATSKEYSDTTLIVKGHKFYVSKLFLASQSSHFKDVLMRDEPDSPSFLETSSLTQRLVNKTLHAKTQFMDQFKQPGRKVVTLEDVDPDDFQVFLEAIYGEPAINDDTINQILKMARMYNADTVIRRCEEFLIEKSAKRAGLKFDIALNFGLESLKKHCITNFKSTKDVRAAIPSDLSRIDRPLLEELLKMNLSFQEP